MAEYEYRGYSIVAMENQFLRVVIAAGKGTDILEFQYVAQLHRSPSL